MTIEKLKSGSYRIKQMYNGKTYRVFVDHKPTKKEAAILIADVLSQGSISGKSGTFNDCALNHINSKEKVLSVATIASYKGILRNLPEWFKEMNVHDIDATAMQLLIGEYGSTRNAKFGAKKTRSAKSVNNMRSFVCSAIRTQRPHFKDTSTVPKTKKYVYYIPTQEEVRKVLNYAKGSPWYIVYMLGAYGMRRGEVCALLVDDLDGATISINKALAKNDDGEYIVKIPKTLTSIRKIAIPQDLAELIREQGYIYRGNPNNINKHLHLIQDKLGMQHFRFHDLRHFFVTEMVEKIPINDVQYLAGHSSPRVTQDVYSHTRADKDSSRRENASNIMAGILCS